MRFYSILIFSLVFTVSNVYSQPVRLQSDNQKAITLFREAQESIRIRDDKEAAKSLEKAIKTDPAFIDAYISLGQVYERLGDNARAIMSFEKAVELDPDYYPETYILLANLRISGQDYEGAGRDLKQYLRLGNRKGNFDKIAQRLLASTEFAVEAMKKPVEFTPVNLGPGINSEYGEFYPALTADDSYLYFTRKLPHPRLRFQEDFYLSVKQDTAWGMSRPLGFPINTPHWNEGAPAITADGRLMVFTVCDLQRTKDYGEGRTGFGSCDLFYSFRSGNQWTEPRNLGVAINTSSWESQPSLSADGRVLYFIRAYPDGRGNVNGQDIWQSTLSGNRWSMAKKLDTLVNSEGEESSVLIHPDGQTLYFSSDGHPGFGGEDIFVSYKRNGTWSKPVNLGYPINTQNNENSLVVSAGGQTALFASNREGGFGDLDLYSFELPASVRPVKVSYAKGIVSDAVTKEKLEARFQLIDLLTREIIVESTSDRITGEFLVTLPSDRNYALNVSKEGYLFYSENFSLKENPDTDPRLFNIELHAIEVGETVVLRNVFFDTDKFDLKPESEVELNKLYDFLVSNPAIKIELSGHTDDQGDEKHNQQLSENRAKAVFEYLVAKGIDANRLSYKGFGESKPIAPNSTAAGRANNRRTEFRIL